MSDGIRKGLVYEIQKLREELAAETARTDGLLPYAQHHVWCRSRLATTCDCGLTQLLGGS